jgi:hypothetical protein
MRPSAEQGEVECALGMQIACTPMVSDDGKLRILLQRAKASEPMAGGGC